MHCCNGVRWPSSASPLDGDNLTSAALADGDKAGIDGLAVEQHGAGPALALATA